MQMNPKQHEEKKKKTQRENIPQPVKSSKEYTVLVDKWLRKDEKYRSEASHASFVLLMSDFLFSQVRLPVKWFTWASELKMIGLSANPDCVTDEDLQRGILDEYQIVVVKMLSGAHSALKALTNKRYDLIGLMEIMNQIEHQIAELTRAINVAKGQEQIGKLCLSLNEISSAYNPNEKPNRALGMNLHEFASSRDCMVLAALLVGRSLTTTIIQLGSSDKYDIVAERDDLMKLSASAEKRKQDGNRFFQNEEYERALDEYSAAIALSKYSGVLYCNRSQAALKRKKFKLAISDGYRATILNPTWSKPYYRQAEGFKGNGQLKAARACNELGLRLCKDSPDIDDLKKQKIGIEKLMLTYVPPTPGSTSFEVNTKKSKKAKKGKKGKASHENSEEQTSGQISDNESAKSINLFNDVAVSRSLEESTTQQPKNSKSTKKNREGFVENGKSEKKAKSENSRKELSAPGDFLRHSMAGSNAYTAKNYSTAAKEYDAAIGIFEKSKLNADFKVSKLDQFVLVYVRGCASMNSLEPNEVARSLDFFATLVTSRKNEEILHPMPYYSIAFAQHTLKNFSLVSKSLQIGIKMIEKRKKIKSLTYPGVKHVIPESQKDKLLAAMRELSKMLNNTLKPDAVCFYDKCEKDDKSDARHHAIFDKEIHRKEMYITDLNFEGFMRISCTWNCTFSFHYKCWAKFKHNMFAKSGDREVLDLQCFTDGCNGTLSRIIMFDQNQDKKKDITSEKLAMKKKEKSAKVPVPRMSKNERNLKQRQKQLKEAKDKKVTSRLASAEAASEKADKEKNKKEPPKVVKDFSETDIANATVIKRGDNEKIHPTSKAKNKNKIKKKHGNSNVTLQDFLKGCEKGVSADDIERVLANRSPDSPFLVPESLREEIEQFESQLSDEDILRITYLYEYFEDFFLQNGPVKVTDNLLNEQYLVLSEEMKNILVNNNGVVAFLRKNEDRFLVVHPYIGLTEQSDQLVELAEAFNVEMQVKQSTLEFSQRSSSSPSFLDTLDTDFDDNPGTLSAFARELYGLGDIPLNDVANITGSKPEFSPAASGPKVFPQVVTLSSNCDETKSAKNKTEPKKVHRGDGDGYDKLCSEMDRYLENGHQSTSIKDLDSFTDNESEFSNPVQDEMLTLHDFGDGNSGSVDIIESTSSEKIESEEEESNGEAGKDVMMTTSETQTDPISSHTEEITKLNYEKKQLEERIINMSEKYTSMCASCQNQIMVRDREIAQLLEALKVVQTEAAERSQHSEAEIKKISKDRLTLHDNVKAVKAQLQEAKNRETELEEQLKEKESDLDRLSCVLQKQRSTWLEEKLSGKREREALSLSLQQANKRCVDAELKSLEIEEGFALKTLLKAQAECEKTAEEFQSLARHHANNPSVQRDVLSGHLKWKENADTCVKHVDQTKQKFAHHAEMIRRGQRLSELATISSPSPPSPGPSLQHAAMNALHIQNASGQVVPLSTFPLNTSPSSSSPTLSYNSDPLPSVFPSRTPQAPIGTGKQGANKITPNVMPANETTTSQPKGSFEKIMVQLRALFPTVSRADLALCIREVRDNNNHSLTGLSFDDIVKQASIVVAKKNIRRKPSNLSAAPGHLASSNSSSASASWTYSRNGRAKAEGSVQVGDEEPCVICHDPLNAMDVQRLSCGHVFHSECLKKWLERNRTCPTCRDYAIDTSEFPALSSRR